ncbi:MAG: CPBP family glutamic-type intramembrane protease [Chromatiales bacterium]|jgi:predicted Abi (CAAX) family protease
MILQYLRENPGQALLTSPFSAPFKAWALLPLFMLISLLVGFSTGLLEIDPLETSFALLLPFTLLIFPSLLEELLFRGILIPRRILESGWPAASRAILLSTLAFVAWHPFNALLFNHSAIPLFLDPWFLVITAALGVTCGYGYVVSRSIWVPVIIHWSTVCAWVLLLGGRNLVLEI